MGQAQNKMVIGKQNSVKFYELDLRLFQKLEHVSSTFPSDIQKVLSELEKTFLKQQGHFLTNFFISNINDRFSTLSVNAQAINNNKTILEIFKINPNILKFKTWYELQTKQRFLSCLEDIQKRYYIQVVLHKNLEQTFDFQNVQRKYQQNKNKKIVFNSLRKKVHIEKQQTGLKWVLFKKLYFYYYLSVLRKFFTSNNVYDKSYIAKFHRQTGGQLCKMMQSGYLSEQEIFDLLYRVIYLQKHQTNIEGLKKIEQIFNQACLRLQYSLQISKKQLQNIKLLTRCYLDELYFKAIKDAQDPDIIEDEDSNLAPLKTFPIARVKQKNRTM